MGKKQKQRGGGGNKSSSNHGSNHADHDIPQQHQQQSMQQQQHTAQQQQHRHHHHHHLHHHHRPLNPARPSTPLLKTVEHWLRAERQGIIWVIGCITLGCLFGFGIGNGWLTGAANSKVAPWRVELGARIRASFWYQTLFFWPCRPQANDSVATNNGNRIGPLDPSHPRVFAVLREAIVRETNGYVHPDLRIFAPAPCGAARGIGMGRDSYQTCQSKCFPGAAKEKANLRRNQRQRQFRDPNSTLWFPPIPNHAVYKQEELLIRVPLSFQMTRTVALDTLLALLPGDIQRKASLHELDDAALLVLLLAHERGVGRHSRWLPYIASLPKEPSCGYSPRLRPYLLKSILALHEEIGVDTYDWKGELVKAHKHAAKIAQGLTKDYGVYLKTPEGLSTLANIEWALCQVISRGIAGSEEYGALRMVPMLDMVNHDANAGSFVELTGKEKLAHTDFVEAAEEDAGTFVAQSIRHGRRKGLKKGQELLVDYNIPHYSPLDWFVSLGFVPRERHSQWHKMDAVLPRVRQDKYGVGVRNVKDTLELWDKEISPQMLRELKELEKNKEKSKQASTSNAGGANMSPTSSTKKASVATSSTDTGIYSES